MSELIIGKELGYIGLDCPNCGRHRVIKYSSGLEICEKCDWCIQAEKYLNWDDCYYDDDKGFVKKK